MSRKHDILWLVPFGTVTQTFNVASTVQKRPEEHSAGLTVLMQCEHQRDLVYEALIAHAAD
jgi:hypothetical protein